MGRERRGRTLGDDGGLVPAGVLGELGEVEREVDQRLERVLRVDALLVSVGLVLLHVESDRGTHRAGAAQTEDDPRAIGVHEAVALDARNTRVRGHTRHTRKARHTREQECTW